MGRRAREPDAPTGTAPARSVLAEVVVALHSDLAEWMGTDAPPKVFDRFAEALHEQFGAVTVVAQVVDRDTLLTGVWSVRNAQPGLRIEISEFEEIASTDTVAVVRFVAEYQHEQMRARRMVTAVLIAGDHGYRWRSLHETAPPPAGL
ncbi:hypothetical protein [Nocardia sp. XZ_19_385]|uniref:hypothetical protein n=1 Tax=Nocardia sp. XZ_19_385 TaxID=2769488 RepID=UPI001E5D44CF|nr:hypothetical protein [Nocardia sp. XZ_19_385]